MAYRDYRNDRNDMACEIPLNDELLTSFSGRGRRRLRDLKQQTETVLKLDKNKSCLQLLYSKNSPAIMSQILSVLFVNFLAWQEEGMKGVKACWAIPDGASVFIVIGLWYAFGDFLEMLSMGAMNGGVYQLLLQSKLLITAVMMIPLKGTTQSTLPQLMTEIDPRTPREEGCREAISSMFPLFSQFSWQLV
eukprot:s3831_g10.t2